VVDSLPKVNERDFLLLEKFFSSLYQSWIVDQFKKENFQNAWRAYRLGSRRLPNDLALHLLGVELALAEDNWTEAERLLSMKEYPASLIDKVKNLQARISELKAQEGKIVIRFTPGIRHIPVTAILNRNSYQTFIVDTGASMVTIPRSSAEKLGLAVDERSPSRKVYTAGGVKFASEVMLSSITVEGWEVNNVKALVLDIPDQPGLGLLGLNYLRRFRMDINSEQGVLLLEPR
jgi:clan AA aspartic protease (TIGR02281 family)